MIYGLYAPEENIIRYVGRSDVVSHRYSQHLKTNSGFLKPWFDRFNGKIKMRLLPYFITENEAILYFDDYEDAPLLNDRKGSTDIEMARPLRYILEQEAVIEEIYQKHLSQIKPTKLWFFDLLSDEEKRPYL